MEHIERARQLLAEIEASLRELIERALAEQEYGDVASIARMADAVARLLRSDDGIPQAGEKGTHPNRAYEDALSPAPHATSRSARAARTFPRFEREGDKLVKIAWSKKDRAEYEHKAPRRIVNLLIESIRARKGEGARFDAPDVLPLKDSKNRKEVPSYQSYLALAWLRHEGIITKYGRDGYALKPTAATSDRLSELWEALPSRG